jgi:hypothetical protein
MRATQHAYDRNAQGRTSIQREDLGTEIRSRRCLHRKTEATMARGALLWLLGVPIPIIILLLLFWH